MSYKPSRIKGCTVRTRFDNRDVTVIFRSPYRWRIYQDGLDVTKSFGHSLRGPTLDPHTPEWDRFHKETKANEQDFILHI